jgi:hypothetical protein
MPETLELISHNTLATSATNWSITNISQSYTDLKVVCAFAQGSNELLVGVLIGFDGSASGYHSITAESGSANTSNTSVGNSSNATSINAGLMDNNSASTFTLDIPNYTSTSLIKSVLFKSGVNQDTFDNSYSRWGVGAWANTTSINSIQFSHPTNTIASGSTVTIYGITKA